MGENMTQKLNRLADLHTERRQVGYLGSGKLLVSADGRQPLANERHQPETETHR